MKALYIGLTLAVMISACSLVADAKPKPNDPQMQQQTDQHKKDANHNGSNQPNNGHKGNKGMGNTGESPNQQSNYSPGYNNSPGYYGTGQPVNNSYYGDQLGYNQGPKYNNGPEQNGYNQPYNEPRYNNCQDYDNIQNQQHARSVLQRTAVVLLDAKRAAEHGHYITGLGRAVDHQQLARELYRNGSYQDAIYHSLLARRLAEQILARNGERLKPEYSCDTIELTYSHRSPRDIDLDLRLNPRKVSSDALALLLIITILSLD